MLRKIFILLLFPLLAGCGGVTPVAPRPEPTSTPQATFATQTSTPVEVKQLSLPEYEPQVITAENLRHLRLMDKIGMGYISKSGISPDGKWVYLITSTDTVYFYSAANMQLRHQMEGTSVQFTPDSAKFFVNFNRGFSICHTGHFDKCTTYLDSKKEVVVSENGDYILVSPQAGFDLYGADGAYLGQGEEFGINFSLSESGKLLARRDSHNIVILDTQTQKEVQNIALSDDLKNEFVKQTAFVGQDQYIVLSGTKLRYECDGPASGLAVWEIRSAKKVFEELIGCSYAELPVYKEILNGTKLLITFPFADKHLPNGNIATYFAELDYASRKYQEFFLDWGTADFYDKKNRPYVIDVSLGEETLVAVKKDRAITFWKLGDQLEQDAVLNNVTNVRFSPDGKHFLAVLSDERIQLRENASRKIVCETDENPNPWLVSFTPDGKWLLFHSQNRIKVLHVSTCAIQASLLLPDLNNSISFHADGSLVAMAAGEVPQLYNLKTRELSNLPARKISGQMVRNVAFHPGQANLLIVSGGTQTSSPKGGFVYVWDINKQSWVAYREFPESIESISISKNNLIAVNEFSSKTSKTMLLDTTNLSTIRELETGAQILSAQGKYAAVYLHWEQEIQVINTAENKTIISTAGGAPSFSPDERFFAHVLDDKIFLWDIEKGEIIRKFSVAGTRFYGLLEKIIFHPNNKILAISSGERTIFIDIETQEIITTIDGSYDNFSFSPDGKWFFILKQGLLELWGVP